MDLEVREVGQAQRQRCRTKVECYRTELKRLIVEFGKAKNAQQSYANGYDSVDEFSDVHLSEAQKQRLLDNSERIERTGKSLEQGYRIVLETQEIGNHVMQDLHHQRETIQKSRHRVCIYDNENHNVTTIFFSYEKQMKI